ncbi:uncharacterized protein [Hyperolius riggenbachi]|uniref:uncharacterized protein n=1 Tax=Hyperolius riggenbachi TaxID=752182 RepID=UPI0035A2D898
MFSPEEHLPTISPRVPGSGRGWSEADPPPGGSGTSLSRTCGTPPAGQSARLLSSGPPRLRRPATYKLGPTALRVPGWWPWPGTPSTPPGLSSGQLPRGWDSPSSGSIHLLGEQDLDGLGGGPPPPASLPHGIDSPASGSIRPLEEQDLGGLGQGKPPPRPAFPPASLPRSIDSPTSGSICPLEEQDLTGLGQGPPSCPRPPGGRRSSGEPA